MTPGRRRLFVAISILSGLVAADLVAHLAVRLVPSAGEVPAGERDRERSEPPPPLFTLSQEVLHPFLGYVQDPSQRELRLQNGQVLPRTIDDLGFVDTWTETPAEEPEGAYRIAVVGGSMAMMLTQLGEVQLREAIEPVVGRPVVIDNWAMAGYKQPQQLLTVAYRVALGDRPDLVLNLDGYNDLVLGLTENRPSGIHPAYPRGWRWRVDDAPDPVAQEQIGRISFLRSSMQSTQEIAGRAPWRWSGLVRLGSVVRLNRLAARIGDAEARLAARNRGAGGYLVRGPQLPGGDRRALDTVISVWFRSSVELDALCRGLGIEYVHALQPNQYVPKAKPMGHKEKALALTDKPAADLVRRQYDRLATEGERLSELGIAFHDLRFVFQPFNQPLYVDDCCHVGRRGNQILGRALGEIVATHLGTPQ